MEPPVAPPPLQTTGPLRELLGLFLWLGVTSFGGPAAHVALMENEVVRRRGWLSRTEFLDLLGATNLIPGPNSTELALHIGLQRAGWRGLLVAGTAFVTPSAVMVAGIAAGYLRWGALPAALSIFAGIKAVMIAVVVHALVGLGTAAVRTPRLAFVGLVSFMAVAGGLPEIAVLVAAGTACAAWGSSSPKPGTPVRLAILPMTSTLAMSEAPATAAGPAGGSPILSVLASTTSIAAAAKLQLGLFAVFLKIGSLVFGSGYVLLAFLRSELVTGRGWISESQLIDAVAAGQITPGPLFTAATFIGFLVAGGWGAAVATVGIFLPAFVLVAASGSLVPRLRGSPRTAAFLDGVNVASLALMALVTGQLLRATIVDGPSLCLAVVGAALLWWRRLNPGWLVLMGVAAGLLRHVIG